DDARDGIPTLHVAFSASDAVLASDAMIALAFRLVAHLPEGAGCVAIVSDAVLDMCRGQADDLSLGSDAGASAWAETCDAKTGAMFVAAAKLGVVASGLPSESLIDNARGLGMAFGRLYQLRDDAADGDGSDADMRAIEADAYERLYASVGSFPAPAALESFGAVVRTSATAAAG
ncbi:MAG: polyprenyl synthetase family protein, partial [Planctomycetota bacterium]